MNNAAIANHLAELAAARAADATITARVRAIRAGHYTAAAVAARAAGVDLASLDAAGVRAALGCGAKIAAAVVAAVAAERATRDQAVAGIVAHVEAGTVPAGEAADVAATLADYLAADGARLSAETVARVEAAIAALQPEPVAPPTNAEIAHTVWAAAAQLAGDRARAMRCAARVIHAQTVQIFALGRLPSWGNVRPARRLVEEILAGDVEALRGEWAPPAAATLAQAGITLYEVPRRKRPAGRRYGHLVAMTGGL